jgi:hypothetical protein
VIVKLVLGIVYSSHHKSFFHFNGIQKSNGALRKKNLFSLIVRQIAMHLQGKNGFHFTQVNLLYQTI